MASELIPRFHGKEVYWWLMQAEEYFRIRKRNEEGKLWWTVAFALRGEALDWWVSWKENNPNPTWGKFTEAILKQFRSEIDSIEKQETRLVGKSRKVLRTQNSHGQKQGTEKRKTQIKKEEPRNSWIWSKQNIEIAMKMMRPTTKGRRRKKKTLLSGHSIEKEQARKGKAANLSAKDKPPDMNITSRIYCKLDSFPTPKQQNKTTRAATIATQEEEGRNKVNGEMTTLERGMRRRPPPPKPPDSAEGKVQSTMVNFWPTHNKTQTSQATATEIVMFPPSSSRDAVKREEGLSIKTKRRRTCMLPEPPDRGGVAVCAKTSMTKIRERRVAYGKKQKTSGKLSKPSMMVSAFLFDVEYMLCKRINKFTKWVAAKSIALSGSLSFKQWDPGKFIAHLEDKVIV